MNYEMLDYLRTQLVWLLDYCKMNESHNNNNKIDPSDEEEYRAFRDYIYKLPDFSYHN